jgi:hypothetical protein
VVFHLVIQPAEHEVDHRAAPDVAAAEYLPAEEVRAGALGVGAHALCPGAKEQPMYTPHSPWCTAMNANATGGDRMRNIAARYTAVCSTNSVASGLRALTVPRTTVAMLAQCRLSPSSSSNGKNRNAWYLAVKRTNHFRSRDWPDVNASNGGVEVGVVLFVVRAGVMTVVLVDPPAVADADEPGVDVADGVVGPPGAEDLPVAGVVADEGKLGGHHRENPAVISCHHVSPSRAKAAPPPAKARSVRLILTAYPAAPPQQAGARHDPLQVGEAGSGGGHVFRGTVGGTDGRAWRPPPRVLARVRPCSPGEYGHARA